MKRVIFVDDEPRILQGLERMLRRQRGDWDMTFVGSGQAALDKMDAAEFDVIVTDMCMPGMNGATLLAKVTERHPDVVRIVLSGHAEMESVLRAIPVTHQFLSKPCESERIVEVVGRACNLMTVLGNEDLQHMIGTVEALPAIPRVYQELNTVLVDPQVSLDAVATIVEQDLAISAKILQLVNSSFFGLASSITSIQQATSYLGVNILRNLVLSMEVFREFEIDKSTHGFSIEEEQAHAVLAARIANKLLADPKDAGTAFLAAMLHDLGKLILATTSAASLGRAVAEARETGRPLYAVEEDATGVSHAEVGGYLLGIWGMPYPIVEAVANHHHPSRVAHEDFDIVGAVHVANALALEQSGDERAPAQLDLDYLAAIGVVDQLPEWRECAAQEFEDMVQVG
ncbi:MAG: HDOD domain-containing protein [Planctomycetota bacterium]